MTEKKILTTHALMFDLAGQELEPYLRQVFQNWLDEHPDINNIRESSESENTLLHVAVSHRNLKVVEILLDRGADVKLKNNDGETPLEIAEKLGSEGIEILRLLKEMDNSTKYSEDDSKEDEIQNLELDVENDELADVERKLGLNKDWNLKSATIQQINESNIVHQFLEKGKYDILDLFLSLDGIDVQKENAVHLTLADITYNEKKYVFLVKLLDKDSKFPKEFDPCKIDESAEGAKELQKLIGLREGLHEAIKNGDLQRVEQLSKEFTSRVCLNLKNQSALATSLIEKQGNIYAFLIYLGMNFMDENEKLSNRSLISLKEKERHLKNYFTKTDESPLHRVLEMYKVCGESSNEIGKVFQGMFQQMFDSKLLRPLLKVLQFEKFELIFDLNSDLTERICPDSGCCRGITDLEEKKCYIGAKKCFTSQSKKKEVFRTLVHELCHMTVNFLYENCGLPYRKNEEDNMKKYQEIVQFVDQKIKAYASTENEKLAQLYELFVTRKEVYKTQFSWETEVIVRCCEIIAQYGDKFGEELLQNEVPELMNFYRVEFLHECEEYSRSAISTKWDSLAYDLSLNHGGLLKYERENLPFEKIPVSIEKYLLPVKHKSSRSIESGHPGKNFNVFLLRTENVYLSKMHVYQELKEKHKFHVDRKCLFFEYNYFCENSILISRELDRFEEVIIVQQQKESFDLNDLLKSLKDSYCKLGKRTIVIVDKDFVDCKNPELNASLITYDWATISGYWRSRLYQKEIKFQGKKVALKQILGKDCYNMIISLHLISSIMSGITIGDDDFSKSQEHDEVLYIKRCVVRKQLENFKENHERMKDYVLLTGIERDKLIDLGFKESYIRTIAIDDCQNVRKEHIILPDSFKDAEKIFRKICEKIRSEKRVHWIHYMEEEFHHLKSDGYEIGHLTFQEKTFCEEDLVKSSLERKTRMILLVDEPGTGKSTILGKLCKVVKDQSPSTLVLKSTLNDIFSEFQKEDDWENIFRNDNSEKILDCFKNSICKGDPAVKELFRVLCTIPIRVSIFLDAIDELPTSWISYAMKLLENLRINTKSQLWLTARTSHQDMLFMALENIPYNLKLWDESNQRHYLCKFWTYSLTKCNLSEARKKISDIVEATSQESATSKLNFVLKNVYSDAMGTISSFRKELENEIFNDFAEYQLKNTNFSGGFEFLGIPLHVFMIANVIYNGNFSLIVCKDVFTLFSTFTEQKIDIFLKEKCGLCYWNDFVKVLIKERKDSIKADHKTIARFSFGFGNSDSLDLSKLKNYDFFNQIGLGKVIGNQFTFIHKTFEEYFYSVSIYEDMQIGNPNGKLLKRILMNKELNPVKIFVNGALEKKMPETIVESNFFTDINLRDCIKNVFHFGEYEDVFSHCIWKYIIFQLESQKDVSITEEFISFYESPYISEFESCNAFRLLLHFRKENWITKIFDFNEKCFEKVILPSFEYCSENELDLILKNIEYSISMKSNCDHCKALCNSQTELEQCSENHSFECLRKRLVKKLFEKKDFDGRNMVKYAIGNDDISVFEKTIDFAKGMFGDIYKELLTSKDKDGRGILCGFRRRKLRHLRNVLEILEKHLTKNEIIKEILMSKDDKYGTPDVWRVIENIDSNGMNEFLDFSRKYINDDDSFKSILLMKNMNQETSLHYCLYNINLFIVMKEVACQLFYVKSDCGKHEFMEWINARDINGYNFATKAVRELSKKEVKEFFKNLRKPLFDDKTLSIILFDGILLCREFAVSFREDYNDYAVMVFDYILSLIGDDRSILNEVILARNNEFGSNFISIACMQLDLGNIKILIEKIRNQILDLNEMKKLLLHNDKEGNTILYYALANKDVSVFSLVCDEILELLKDDKEELKSLLMKVNTDGENIITLKVRWCESEEVKKLIEKLKRNQILNLNELRKLFLQNDIKGNTILHNTSANKDVRVFSVVCDEINKMLNEDELKSLIMKSNEDGMSFVYFVDIMYTRIDIFRKLIEYFGKELMTELLLRIDNEGNTCLHHWVKRGIGSSALKENIKQISEIINKSDIEKLILTKNKCGRLFHHGYYYDKEHIKNYLKTLLSEDSFQKVTEIEELESLTDK